MGSYYSMKEMDDYIWLEETVDRIYEESIYKPITSSFDLLDL